MTAIGGILQQACAPGKFIVFDFFEILTHDPTRVGIRLSHYTLPLRK